MEEERTRRKGTRRKRRRKRRRRRRRKRKRKRKRKRRRRRRRRRKRGKLLPEGGVNDFAHSEVAVFGERLEHALVRGRQKSTTLMAQYNTIQYNAKQYVTTRGSKIRMV